VSDPRERRAVVASGRRLATLRSVPNPDLDEIASAFERDGFVNAGPVLDAAECDALGGELERYIGGLFRGGERAPGRPIYIADVAKASDESHYQLCGMWQVSELFRRLIANPRLVEIAAHLARTSTLQVWSDTVQYKPANNGAPFQWHQDAPYHISITPATKLLGAWIAFDDADVESGCMWMVPGSHRWGECEPHLWKFAEFREAASFGDLVPPDLPAERAGEWRGAVACPVRAGEVHFHHALTWHGSPTNRSSRPRRAYTIHYMPDSMRVSERFDVRLPLSAGTPMTEAGPAFPIVYGSPA
jgi:phytanoyl-CoA hydroxylase